MNHLAVLVDEQDKVIGHKKRYDLSKGDIIRIALLWLENSKGQVLLAQRSFKKDHDPGLWGPAAGGTVEVGETYEANIYKEAEEEIGITRLELQFHNKNMYWRPDGVGRFAAWYRATLDWPLEKFVLQKEEVEAIAWFDKSELKRQLLSQPEKFVPSAPLWIKQGLL